MFGKEIRKKEKLCYKNRISRYDHPGMGGQGEFAVLQP
jgi:hypothetical protein